MPRAADPLRIDPVTGAPVVIVPERQSRPLGPDDGCPFCVGGREAPQPYRVRAFPNRWPALPDGRCEVVLYSPDHHASLADLGPQQALELVSLWSDRTAVLGRRPDVSYVLIFENRGWRAGATIEHPHGQIYAFSAVPPVPRRELTGGAPAPEGGCTLCARPAAELVVLDEGGWSASVPPAPVWPYELSISPARHLPDLPTMVTEAGQKEALAACLSTAAARLDDLFGEPMPYMLWVHQRPTDGGSWPEAHLHIHLCGMLRGPGVMRYVAGAEAGAGIYFNPVDPLTAARALREVPARP